MSTIDSDECWGCERLNPSKPLVPVHTDEEDLIRSRVCDEYPNCKPYTSVERKALKPRFTERPPGGLSELDPGIRDAVAACWSAGIPTAMSCDGHGRQAAWISFVDLKDAQAACNILTEHDPLLITKEMYFVELRAGITPSQDDPAAPKRL